MIDPFALFYLILIAPFTALPILLTVSIGMLVDSRGKPFPPELAWATLGVTAYCALTIYLVSRMRRDGSVLGFSRTGWWVLIASATGVGLFFVAIMVIDPR